MPRLKSHHVLATIVLLLCSQLALPVAAAPLCFDGLPACVDHTFRPFWESNGGLPVFGYSTAPSSLEFNRDAGQHVLTQWFERNRLEFHPHNAAPYQIMLGRLGDARLRQQGRDWQREPRDAGPQASCLWFAQTSLNVCDQSAAAGFASYWRSYGLEFDGRPGVSFEESLALWGLPLTMPRLETNSSGDAVLTQWFERARFEWHPNNPRPYNVLLGLLGNETLAPNGATPAAPTPTATPSPPTATPAPSLPVPPTATPVPPVPPASSASDEALRVDLLARVNALHVAAGCPPLRPDERLDAAAQAHADDIAVHTRIDHVGTDGAKLQTRLSRVGYPYYRASESIAVYQSPQQVVAMWMDEPPDGWHRRNIEDCAYRDAGVGMTTDARGRRWWVMDVASQRAAP